MPYRYLGDKLTDPSLKSVCEAVRRPDGKCIRGKNGSMLVSFDGVKHVVIGRLLRKTTPKIMKYIKGQNVLLNSINGINRMLASRKEELRQMAEFLEDPYNSEKTFPYGSLYRRGPKLMKEVDKLILIRLDLWRIIRNS